jgi:hypothetical protein
VETVSEISLKPAVLFQVATNLIDESLTLLSRSGPLLVLKARLKQHLTELEAMSIFRTLTTEDNGFNIYLTAGQDGTIIFQFDVILC